MIDRRWLVLAVLFIARCSLGYQFQSVASSASFMEAELHIGYAVIGTLIGLQSIPGVALSLPSGMLLTRFGDRAVFVASLLLMIAGGLVVSVGEAVPVLMVGRLASGAGAVLFNVVLTKMLTDWFAKREIVFAMGTLMSSWPFGIALGLIVQGRLAESFGWRGSMATTALFCLISLVLLLTLYRPPQDDVSPGSATATESTWWNPPDWPSLRGVLIASLAWSCFNLGLILLFSFGTSFLGTRGVAGVEAAAVTSLALWIAILSIPLGGFLLQRVAMPRLMASLSYLAAAAALVALALGASPVIACIAFGIAIGPGPGAIMALPARVLSPQHRATGLGIFGSLYAVIVGIGPWAAGLVVDAAQTPAAALLLGAVLFAICVPLMMLFEASQRRPA
jgi:predicted MFS family arabinose efflux permease